MSSKTPGAPALTTIPVLEPAFGSADRPDDASRTRRGHLPSTLLRGQKAEEAIAIAQAETARYREELDAARITIGRQSDLVRDFNSALARNVSPSGMSFALPPDPITAELLRRDAIIHEWTGAYRDTVNRAAAAEQAHLLDRAHLLDQIEQYKLERTKHDLASELLARRLRNIDADAVAALNAQLSILELERTESQEQAAALREQLAEAKRATSYYINLLRKSQAGELLGRTREDTLRAEIERMRNTNNHTTAALITEKNRNERLRALVPPGLSAFRSHSVSPDPESGSERSPSVASSRRGPPSPCADFQRPPSTRPRSDAGSDTSRDSTALPSVSISPAPSRRSSRDTHTSPAR